MLVHKSTTLSVTENEAFEKAAHSRSLAFFLLSSCRVNGSKRNLSKQLMSHLRFATSKHALSSLRIARGDFAYLRSFIEVRKSNIVIEYRISLSNLECQSVFVWTRKIFSKWLLVYRRIFSYQKKKDAFQEIH